VPVRHQLPFSRESLQRVAFKHALVAGKVIKYFWLEDEETTVYPAFPGLRLLGEFTHRIAVEPESAEARGGTYCGDGRQPPMSTMELEQLLNVDVRDSVAVRHHARSAVDVALQSLHATTGHRVETRVDQPDAPPERLAIHDVDLTGAQIYKKIIRVNGQAVKVFLQLSALVAARYKKLLEAVIRVYGHDVPDQWLAADLDHGLRPRAALFGDARTLAACEDDDRNAHSIRLI